jgi:hypothetical protein
LSFRDKNGKRRSALVTLSDGSSQLQFYDAKGTVIWQAPR